MEASTYELNNDLDDVRNPWSRASRIVLIRVTYRIPAPKRRMSHSEATTEDPKRTYESESPDRCSSNVDAVLLQKKFGK